MFNRTTLWILVVALAAGLGLTSLGATATNPLTIALWTGGFAAAGAAAHVHWGLPAAALLFVIGPRAISV